MNNSKKTECYAPELLSGNLHWGLKKISCEWFHIRMGMFRDETYLYIDPVSAKKVAMIF
jgi:hypothetical protein